MDFDGDGFVDLDLTEGDDASHVQIACDSNQGFSSPSVLQAGMKASKLNVADLNDAGYDDLLLGLNDTGRIDI